MQNAGRVLGRVMLTTGRDVILANQQPTAPTNAWAFSTSFLGDLSKQMADKITIWHAMIAEKPAVGKG
jgi:hypothetical protein